MVKKTKEEMQVADDDFGEFLNKACSLSEHVWIPKGESTWRLPTGISSLDSLLGGGIGSGQVCQIYGHETTGKTTIAYGIMAQAVKMNKRVFFIPLERYEEKYAQLCGIDTTKRNSDGVLLFRTLDMDYAEYAFNLMIEAVRKFDVDLVVIDSIAAAVPKATMEKKQPTEDMDRGPSVASQARSVSEFMRKFQGVVRRQGSIFIAINQLTTNIGRMHSSQSPTGGNALQHYTDLKLSLYGRPDKDTGIIETDVTVVKGKDMAVKEFKSTKLFFKHADPRSTIVRDVIELALESKAIVRGGSWFNIDATRKYQGMEGLIKAVTEDNALFDELYTKVTGVIPEQTIIPIIPQEVIDAA